MHDLLLAKTVMLLRDVCLFFQTISVDVFVDMHVPEDVKNYC